MNPSFNDSGDSLHDYEFTFEYYLNYSRNIDVDVSMST